MNKILGNMIKSITWVNPRNWDINKVLTEANNKLKKLANKNR